jgi:hypothetical protein
MDISIAAVIMPASAFTYSAWLTSIVFCSTHDNRPLLIAAAAFFPVGLVHGNQRVAWRLVMRPVVIDWAVNRTVLCLQVERRHIDGIVTPRPAC